MTADVKTTSNLLTVIITTSVTPSAPSTELISAVLRSFASHCPGLSRCKVIVVFDGYDHIVPVARLKKGSVTNQQAIDFDAYKQNVKKLILEQHYRDAETVSFTQALGEAEYGSPCNPQNVVSYVTAQSQDKKVIFIESSRRLGFGLAVRSALRLTETPYVWVQQHDWVLTFDLPIDPLLQVMQDSESNAHSAIRYVCLAAVRMLSYATSPDVTRHPALRDLTSALKGDFTPSTESDIKIPLTPMFSWHDKPHIASTDHYLKSVFPTRLAMLRGDFIEDKIGQRARSQMKDGLWHKWATWLYYPNEGKQLCLRHLQGRTWEGTKREAEKAVEWRKLQEAVDTEKS